MGLCYPISTQSIYDLNKENIDYHNIKGDGTPPVWWYGQTPADCNTIPPNLKESAIKALSEAKAANPTAYRELVCDSRRMEGYNAGIITRTIINNINNYFISDNIKNSDGTPAVAWIGQTQNDCKQIPHQRF
jgi:hypothetical protein